MTEIVERFRRDLAEVCWKDLRIHLQRDALIMVSADLDLVETATAVAEDDTDQVETWIVAGQIGKPTREQIDGWEREQDKPFRILIVQPYILIQAIEHA